MFLNELSAEHFIEFTLKLQYISYSLISEVTGMKNKTYTISIASLWVLTALPALLLVTFVMYAAFLVNKTAGVVEVITAASQAGLLQDKGVANSVLQAVSSGGWEHVFFAIVSLTCISCIVISGHCWLTKNPVGSQTEPN